MGLVESPVWTEDNWALETVTVREGKRRDVREARRSTDISLVTAIAVT